MDQFKNFDRDPQSAAGDFYVVEGECAACGLPHVIAPALVGWVDNDSKTGLCI